jgi:hypothetical protein
LLTNELKIRSKSVSRNKDLSGPSRLAHLPAATGTELRCCEHKIAHRLLKRDLLLEN